MHDISEKELFRTRLRFIDIIKSFFISAPDSERFSRWRGTFAALSRESITPEMDKHTSTLNSLVSSKKLEDFADEYYALFVDPFSETPLNLSASHHLDGRNHGESLIAVRQLIHDADIGIDSSVKLPEDSLPVMMDILSTLIEHEANGIDTHGFQEKLINDLLIPSIKQMVLAAGDNPTAEFYLACLEFCSAYLSLEKDLAG